MKNNQGSEDLKENLSEYIPQAFVPYVHDLLCSTKVLFRIVPPRKTKLGDFRKPLNGKSIPQITVNNNLNPYAFLITTLHEIAHLHTYLRYGHSVKPHGKEWKYEFQQVLLPLISAQKFPETLKVCLKNTITNTKASSFSDIPLNRALREFDRDKKGCHLEKIELEYGPVVYKELQTRLEKTIQIFNDEVESLFMKTFSTYKSSNTKGKKKETTNKPKYISDYEKSKES